MSGGPPHHPHGRQVPTANPAWNHLQVPNYFPSRQPQHAHMSTDHATFLHQPAWLGAPAAEPMKPLPPHSHLFGLEQMLSDARQFPRPAPGVDLSLAARNGSQNGDLPPAPISLSVRDAAKINSLSPGDIHAVELTKCPPSPEKKMPPSPTCLSVKPLSSLVRSVESLSSKEGKLVENPSGKPHQQEAAASKKPPEVIASKPLKVDSSSLVRSDVLSVKPASPLKQPASPGLSLKPGSPAAMLKPASPGMKSASPITNFSDGKNIVVNKRLTKRVDSILERLNPMLDKTVTGVTSVLEHNIPSETELNEKTGLHGAPNNIVVSNDENSNSSSLNAANQKDEDVLSPYSNEDSLDSNKSRRKRKPSKTVRLTKEDEKAVDSDCDLTKTLEDSIGENKSTETKIPQDDKLLLDEPDGLKPEKKRRKTSSESETIDNIAAMVQEVIDEKSKEEDGTSSTPINSNQEDVQINNEEIVIIKETPPLLTAAQKKATNTHFVEVENKLEEMFAGIEDDVDPLKTDQCDENKVEVDSLLKLDESIASTSQDVSSTSTGKPQKKAKKKSNSKRKNLDMDDSKKSKKSNKKLKTPEKNNRNSRNRNKKGSTGKPLAVSSKIDSVKDIYAYDSNSNASSNKSRGPFIHIRGPRDSPISVNVVNTPTVDEDPKPLKTKKYHDDNEYRHKVRSKGLHSSTLSNKYDSQTKDASWICAFCKRGPHASYLNDPAERDSSIALGDLFGPYVITTNSAEYERRLNDPFDKCFKSKKIVKALDSQPINNRAASGKKSKRKHSESLDDETEVYLGIVDTGNKTYEIWAHEDCMVWSSGVYLVGSKIVGLEEAVWTSCNVVCDKCSLKGGNVCCVRRGCLKMMHFCCAKASEWALDETSFKSYCTLHKTAVP